MDDSSLIYYSWVDSLLFPPKLIKHLRFYIAHDRFRYDLAIRIRISWFFKPWKKRLLFHRYCSRDCSSQLVFIRDYCSQYIHRYCSSRVLFIGTAHHDTIHQQYSSVLFILVIHGHIPRFLGTSDVLVRLFWTDSTWINQLCTYSGTSTLFKVIIEDHDFFSFSCVSNY